MGGLPEGLVKLEVSGTNLGAFCCSAAELVQSVQAGKVEIAVAECGGAGGFRFEGNPRCVDFDDVFGSAGADTKTAGGSFE